MVVGGLLFLCAFLGFKQGLRLGMTVANKTIPPPIKTPIQAITDIVDNVKNKKVEKDIQDEINLMQNYNGDLPKED